MGTRLSKQQRLALEDALDCKDQGIGMYLPHLCNAGNKSDDRPYYDLDEAMKSINRLIARKLLIQTGASMFEITEKGIAAIAV